MVHAISNTIHQDLIAHSNPIRKEKIAEYLKTSSLGFIGVELPDIHLMVNTHIKGLKIDDLPSLMDALWSIKTFETRVAAIDVLKVYAKKGDVAIALKIADRWVEDADTWGVTDPLCSPTIGILLLRDPKVVDTLKSWRTSENFWKRRCSLLPYLYLTLKTQYRPEYSKKILEAVTPHISDEEFFVGKAAGWVLRELSKRDPELIQEYFKSHGKRMTKLVIREGSKKL
ncbi:MAG: DNA alkylation repair protein [Candidatus Thorarchaeota archaeon]|nr:DNA alkylation repair protein [Candidatus Thorarchaeota archaeon]